MIKRTLTSLLFLSALSGCQTMDKYEQSARELAASRTDEYLKSLRYPNQYEEAEMQKRRWAKRAIVLPLIKINALLPHQRKTL